MAATIRPSRPADVEAVRAMHYSHLSPEAKAEFFKLNPQLAARTERILAGSEGLCLIAESGDAMVGYLIATLVDNPLSTIKYASLDNLLVLPDFRRQGIGSDLVAGFRQWAKSMSAQRLRIDASPRNPAALEFYAHQGFTPATLTLESPVD